MVLEVKKLMGTKRGRDVQVESAEICTSHTHTPHICPRRIGLACTGEYSLCGGIGVKGWQQKCGVAAVVVVVMGQELSIHSPSPLTSPHRITISKITVTHHSQLAAWAITIAFR